MTIEADVTQSLSFEGFTIRYRFFLPLHCLPRPLEDNMKHFIELKPHLAPNGVVYVTTILGKDAQHKWFGSLLMKFYNRKGIFGN
ncbi:S-adenosyl-L-methionine dependent methyltransferase [Penicillium argentinense]|uniref:S-adenosyl-L-methionine dependent methyltransferase n=1 Tax=Penicillium argentinense TaxID=1131581 RepID=A0A9W9FM00_9EURO|nr:S-adenosyl-L-methionine dependent methyltransferase [Penicillium argentinense]KAJ5102603.1 S-adenosyl-L-methionine dependent methyltransferase [Penicillium argentinense]